MGTRVLAADDEKLIRMEMKLMLGREGFEVDTAATCAEASCLLHERHYDLVLTDVDLPDGSGLELLQHAKTMDPTTCVILLTGSNSLVTPEQAEAAGAQNLLLKPFSLKDLLADIRRALRLVA